jgi:hypothetical protein
VLSETSDFIVVTILLCPVVIIAAPISFATIQMDLKDPRALSSLIVPFSCPSSHSTVDLDYYLPVIHLPVVFLCWALRVRIAVNAVNGTFSKGATTLPSNFSLAIYHRLLCYISINLSLRLTWVPQVFPGLLHCVHDH